MIMKNKILFLHDYPLCEGGGIEVQTFDDAKTLSKLGYEVTLASTRLNSENITSQDDKNSFPKKVQNNLILDLVNSRLKLEKLIDDSDLIYILTTFSLRPGMMTALKILSEKDKKFFVALGTNLGHLPFSRLANLTQFEQTNLMEEFVSYLKNPNCNIIGLSYSSKETLKKLDIKKDLNVIHNAKDWSSFVPTGELNPTKTSLTFIGEVSIMKGVYVLIEAFKKAHDVLPDLTLRIIGGGPEIKHAQALAKSLGIGDNIEFTGYVDNKYIPDYLSATEAFVLPSFTETWGNVAMEALGLGVPIIVSNAKGLYELTQEGKLGLVFQRGDSHDLFIKIKKLFTDSKTKDSLTAPHIKKYIQQSFSLEKRSKEMAKLFSAQ